MPDSFTANLNLTKPEVGASRDAWGGKWNGNADILDAAIKALQDKPGVPSGLIAYFPLPTPPEGWLKCNGAAISRTVYAKLYAIFGTSQGPGNGVDTFNLPDYRGEFIRNWDDGRGVDPGRQPGGTFQAQNMPDHRHETNMGQSGGNFNQWTNDWPWGGRTVNQTLTRGRVGPMVNEIANYTVTSYTSSMKFVDGSEVRPRNIALTACIKI